MRTIQAKRAEIIETLENYVGKRFNSLRFLEEDLSKSLRSKKDIKLSYSSQNYETEHTPDWNLIGSVDSEEVFCDFDIYFLYDRHKNLYITEVGYVFE